MKKPLIQFLTRLSSEFHVQDWHFQFSKGELFLPDGELEWNHRQIANLEKAQIDLVSSAGF
jgi:hypothetical protein